MRLVATGVFLLDAVIHLTACSLMTAPCAISMPLLRATTVRIRWFRFVVRILICKVTFLPFRFLQFGKSLHEGFSALFIEDVTVGDEAAGIVPLFILREDMESKELDDLDARGEVFGGACAIHLRAVAVCKGFIDVHREIEIRLRRGRG